LDEKLGIFIKFR